MRRRGHLPTILQLVAEVAMIGDHTIWSTQTQLLGDDEDTGQIIEAFQKISTAWSA
ncbi:MAG: hypothetical protein ACR2OU_12325 [Thermomicrobiales bacterium]